MPFKQMIWILHIWYPCIYPTRWLEVKVRFCQDTAASALWVGTMCVWLKGSFPAGDSTRRPAALVAAQMYEWSGCRLRCVPPLSATTRSLLQRKQPSHFHTHTHALGFDAQFPSLAARPCERRQLLNCGQEKKERDTSSGHTLMSWRAFEISEA